MLCKLYCISDSDKDYKGLVDEFSKRLWKQIEIVTIKPAKNWSREQIIAKDTQEIISKIQKDNNYKVLLSKDGKLVTTMDLYEICRTYNNVSFIIWWPYGLDEQLLNAHVGSKIAFGKITLPHGLCKVVILEQLFRVTTIMENRDYHY